MREDRMIDNVPVNEKPGEVAIEMEALHIAMEKNYSLTTQLVDKLHEILNVAAFSEKLLDDALVPEKCPLASSIRIEKCTAQQSNNKLAELLEFIEL